MDKRIIGQQAETLAVLTEKFREDLSEGIDNAVNECQSPIEQELLLAMIRESLSHSSAVAIGGSISIITEVHHNIADVGLHIYIIPQYKTGPYIADFMVECFRGSMWDTAKKSSLLIECDGHDFHEKTKKQVVHGKKRDRYFTKHGYKFMHFSGSEIFNNSDGCAKQIIELVTSECNSHA